MNNLYIFALFLVISASCKVTTSNADSNALRSYADEINYIPIIANVDDDDRDGKLDWKDNIVNGEKDLEDLVQVVIEKPFPFKLKKFQHKAVGMFVKYDNDYSSVDLEFSNRKEVYVEAKQFAGANQARKFSIKVGLEKEGGETVTHTLNFDLAPFVVLQNSARTEVFYIADGAYNTKKYATQLRAIFNNAGVTLHKPYYSKDWQDMWMQDTMELGYAQLPGRKPMHVVLNGIRGYDGFGPTLLGPDMGLIRIGEDRKLTGGDDWADWYGNLEVTAPTERYPLGRIYYGYNSRSKVGLHPEVIAFFEAQNVQKPFSVETGYLTIKHVDEIFNFVKSSST